MARAPRLVYRRGTWRHAAPARGVVREGGGGRRVATRERRGRSQARLHGGTSAGARSALAAHAPRRRASAPSGRRRRAMSAPSRRPSRIPPRPPPFAVAAVSHAGTDRHAALVVAASVARRIPVDATARNGTTPTPPTPPTTTKTRRRRRRRRKSVATTRWERGCRLLDASPDDGDRRPRECVRAPRSVAVSRRRVSHRHHRHRRDRSGSDRGGDAPRTPDACGAPVSPAASVRVRARRRERRPSRPHAFPALAAPARNRDGHLRACARVGSARVAALVRARHRRGRACRRDARAIPYDGATAAGARARFRRKRRSRRSVHVVARKRLALRAAVYLPCGAGGGVNKVDSRSGVFARVARGLPVVDGAAVALAYASESVRVCVRV